MATSTRRKTRRHLTQLGIKIGVSLDPLTRSRIVHGVHVARLLGIECNQASIVRVGVALWIDHIDKALKRLATMDAGSDQSRLLIMRETWRLKCANNGSVAPWKDELYLERRLERAVREVGAKFPEFASIVREYAQRELTISMDELAVRGEDIRRFLNGEGVKR